MVSHVRVDRVVVHANEKAGDAAERRRDREYRHVHAVDVDTALLRRVPIQRGCPHGPAELGEAQEEVEQSSTADAYAGDQNIERSDGAVTDLDAPRGDLQRHAARV